MCVHSDKINRKQSMRCTCHLIHYVLIITSNYEMDYLFHKYDICFLNVIFLKRGGGLKCKMTNINDRQRETDRQRERQREKGDIHIECTGVNIIIEYMHTFINRFTNSRCTL